MDNQQPVSRDVQLPGQDVESVDLDPTVEPEPAESAPDTVPSEEDAASAEDASQPDTAASNPGLGNTLIQPDNS